jgi:L-cysteine:1D-myo-inositol 2-amino-2-deoxy-alpha-D-glucopyranoside ligase
MHAWSAPEVPTLAGQGPALSVYDTSYRDIVVTAPGPTARMYVCGITPYDATHMGHAATYLAFDLVQRVWRDAGHEVHYVQNVTDVDDPLLERALQTGDDWVELAARETQLFRDDMAALRILPPDDYVGAVEAIPLVVERVKQLLDAGVAYRVDDDIYFSVHSDPSFGSVSNLDDDDMLALFAERGGDPKREGKRHPLDCLLWQAERLGEPSWHTDLGPGRPGWHIECVGIALNHLGMSFDVQGGGSDLAFPHHEMGASEAHLITGQRPYAKAYVHAGMVSLDGEKMSKSRGNLVFVSRLREDGVDPMAIRLALLGHHYRSDWEWTEDEIPNASKRLDAWRAGARKGSATISAPVVSALREHLSQDLDAPGALKVIDAWADMSVGASGGSDPAATREVVDAVDALLGIDLR